MMFAASSIDNPAVVQALEAAMQARLQGRFGDADWILRDALLRQPAHPHLLAMIAEVSEARGRGDDAVGFYRRLLALRPADLPVRLRAIDALESLGRHDEALALSVAAPASQQGDLALLNRRLTAMAALGRIDERLNLLDLWIERMPGEVGLYKDRADTLADAGRPDEAVASLREALRRDPKFGEAWFTLSNIKSVRLTDDDLARMRRALKGRIDPAQAVRIHFALGKAHEDRGEADRAFHHYDAANRGHAVGLGKLIGDTPEFVSLMQRLLDAPPVPACDSAAPIFVLGLHRSGSTLVEQILASHRDIEGTRELDIMPRLFRELRDVQGGDAQAIAALVRDDGTLAAALGRQYVERAAAYRTSDKPMFIDKQPANWLFVPFIRRILPHATIIDARRHPMACGFSNFRQFFPRGVVHSYSQQSIGKYYRAYLDMMEAVDAAQPGAVHPIVNERLIDDPEPQIRSLLDFVGVDFDPAVMRFHENRRAVHTPSAEQVRRPLNRDGVDAWKAFDRHLGPLREALGDALDRWDRV